MGGTRARVVVAWRARVRGTSISGENGALESPAGQETSRRPLWLKEGAREGRDGVEEGLEATIQTALFSDGNLPKGLSRSVTGSQQECDRIGVPVLCREPVTPIGTGSLGKSKCLCSTYTQCPAGEDPP